MLNRRNFIGLTAAAGLAPNIAGAQTGIRDFNAPYAPVIAASSRVIRTVVGLRPYRPEGFVLRRERFGRRTVIHNYGHGGCGVTLSWGCSRLAVGLAGDTRDRRAAVIGAGVMGMTTALLLLRRGYDVTIYAEKMSPQTTSNIAAAYWSPTTLFSRAAVDEEFLQRFKIVARQSQRDFQHLANNPRYGVWWIRALELDDDIQSGPMRERYVGDDLFPGRAPSFEPAHNLGFPYAVRQYSMMIDPDIYLPALIRDIEAAGGRFVQKRFDTPDQLFDLKERLFFNCTGLGAAALFGDDGLQPVRGQLTMLLPQPEIDYGYILGTPDGVLYMFPRRGAIVLGGTTQYGDGSLEVRADEHVRMLTGHAAIAANLN